MATYVPAKYGTEYIFYVGLESVATAGTFQANATLASGDVKLSKNGGTLANLTTLPTVTPASGKLVKVTLSATEMECDNATVIFSDASGNEWRDLIVNIQTAARQIDDLAYPTTSGRSIDVTTTGEVGIDWANIGSPTTSVNLSGTTVKTATDVETDTQDIQTRIPAALVGGRMDSSVGAMASGVLTATAIASDAITAAKLAADVTTEIQSGLLTSTAFDAKIGTPAGASLAADVAAVKSETAAILTDTAEIGTAGAGLTALASATSLATLAGYVDTEVAAIKAKTDNLPASPANEATLTTIAGYLDTEVAAILSAVDTEVGAIKAVTDNLPDAGALTTITNNVAAILADTGTDGVKVAADQSGVTIGTVNALGTQAKADVNGEVLDVLNVDTFAEPTSVPAATSSLRAKIGWLFKLARNKMTQTSTTQTLYADDGTTADNTAAASDNGSVFSRGEWS